MREKLTPAVARRATEAKEPVFIWDTSLPGFGLMVTKNGHRSWPVQYRYRGKSQRKNLSGVLDLTKARKAAKAILGAAAAGKDPIGEEREQTKAVKNTLEFVYGEYFRRDGAKLRTGDRQRQDMERLVFPTLAPKSSAARSCGFSIASRRRAVRTWPKPSCGMCPGFAPGTPAGTMISSRQSGAACRASRPGKRRAIMFSPMMR
jgi:hypothetical protein